MRPTFRAVTGPVRRCFLAIFGPPFVMGATLPGHLIASSCQCSKATDAPSMTQYTRRTVLVSAMTAGVVPAGVLTVAP